jgi:Holliday junction DNA helicase RuvA
MFAYIKGQLVYSSPTIAVLEANGIGYKICIPANLFARLPQLGCEAQLHTSFVVREQSQTLYGFSSGQERDLFETLLTVTGIGPKTALSLIGHLSAFELQHAISNGDLKAISRVPGIGKKTAERLIIEMRDKLGNLFTVDPSDLAVYRVSDPKAQTIGDAMSALISLGYNQVVAQKAIKKTLNDQPEDIDLAALITCALKNI